MKIRTWIKYETEYIPPRCRNPLLNAVEEAIESTDNVMEAGLLTMAICAK